MADEAINYMKGLNAAAPEKPFFLYYVPGGTHAPHHPTPEWIKKISDMHLFDKGWNELREQIFANQKKLGVIPANTQLTPWPDSLPKWDTLNADREEDVHARQADIFAAYVAYTDHEIGRVIQAVEDLGKLDNTLIIYISGDNGTSAEGSTIGTPFDLAAIQAINIPVEAQLKFYDVLGSDLTTPHMSVAWSWAFDTPFKWTKQVASFFGGTRQGMVMSWPGHIKDVGGIRTQFHHIIDIVPTILEATGIQAPVMVNGIAQSPIEGVSMAYTWDKANEKAQVQARDAILRDVRQPRDLPRWLDGRHAASATPVAHGHGQDARGAQRLQMGALQHRRGLTRRTTISRRRIPEKLKELQELFLVEAKKYQVFPLDNSILERLLTPRPSSTAGRTEFTYSGEMSGLPDGSVPNTLAKSYSISAEVEIPAGRRRGNAQHARRPLRRLRPLPAEGQARLHLQPPRRWSDSAGKARTRSRRANTPSCLTSSTTAPAWPRAAPASCRWTARKSTARRSRTPSRPS